MQKVGKLLMRNETRNRFPIKYSICCILVLLSALICTVSQSGAATETGFRLLENWTGDFDGMVVRRSVRALVVFSKTNYFLDGAQQLGATYEGMKEFEKKINKKLKRGHLKVHVVFIPVPRDRLIPMLLAGKGDIAAAGLTITPERKKQVDFATPLIENVDEIIVTGPNSPKVTRLEDLSGTEIHVRKSSSYYESLIQLNDSFKEAGSPPVLIKEASEYLEDEDLLEMVNAGLIPMTVVDNYLAKFWAQIFKDITLHPEIAVRREGQIAWMIRKNSPKLKQEINEFVKSHKKGTLFGNIILKRYFENMSFVRNNLSDEDLAGFKAVMDLFKKYAGIYDMDWLLVAALAYQESRLDQSMRSPAGAVGVMQLLPSTAAGNPVNIPDIEKIESNIHAGVKYLRWLHDRYFKDEDMSRLDKGLFTFASYNAGPARVMGLRRQAAEMGFDPNVWFNNVEVAAAKSIGRETVQYVSNIYKYYIAYKLIADKLQIKREELHKSNAN
jgi:membrane-bound lytic murein transglycosylase MltF